MIIDFWNLYNRRIVEVIKKIPKEKLSAECSVGDKSFTLEFLIDDYVVHLKHHLDQILDIEN